ncbi:tetraspanin-4-like [Glandiceps talaboti]
MALEGCARVIKFTVFFFNLIFWILGIAILGIGIWIRVTKGDYATLTSSIPMASAANLIIAVGIIVMIVGFVGCLGAWKENQCLLLTFFFLMLIIFIMEVAAGILGYVYRGQVETKVKSDLMAELDNYGKTGQEGLTSTWDRLQNEEKCCGVENYMDWWNTNPAWNNTQLPDSCCMEHSTGCGMGAADITKFHTDGCAMKLEAVVGDNLYLIGGVAIAIAVIQLLGMIFALFLCCEVRKAGKYV